MAMHLYVLPPFLQPTQTIPKQPKHKTQQCHHFKGLPEPPLQLQEQTSMPVWRQKKCCYSIVVYQATCHKTNKKYIGNTQQHVKTRLQGHIQDIKNLFIASLIPDGTTKKNVKDFIKVKVDILWQGDPLSCVKTFGTRSCKLCTKERYAIIKLTRETPNLAINKCNEVHGACRHKPWFHRFDNSENANSSTDESRRTKGL